MINWQKWIRTIKKLFQKWDHQMINLKNCKQNMNIKHPKICWLDMCSDILLMMLIILGKKNLQLFTWEIKRSQNWNSNLILVLFYHIINNLKVYIYLQSTFKVWSIFPKQFFTEKEIYLDIGNASKKTATDKHFHKHNTNQSTLVVRLNKDHMLMVTILPITEIKEQFMTLTKAKITKNSRLIERYWKC